MSIGPRSVKPEATVLFALALYLALHQGESIARSAVLELLWPSEKPASRRHALRQLLYRLKQAGLTAEGDAETLHVAQASVDCDLSKLLSDDWAGSVALADVPLPTAILPGYGPPISAQFSEWLDSVRDEAASQIRRAALRHVATARNEGRWTDLETAARRCLAVDPLNEEATLGRAEAVAMRGARAESLRILDGFLLELGEAAKDQKHPARVLRRRIVAVPEFRAPRQSDPELIARGEEMAWLNERLDRARFQGGAAVMLTGPAGIGKTAVIRSFVTHAEMRGWRFGAARVQASDTDRPMALFVELIPRLFAMDGALGAAPEALAQLRRLIDDRDASDVLLANSSTEAEAVQARIRAAMLDVVTAIADEGPLVVVLEDLHWIDNQSLRLFTWLLEHVTEAPVFWLTSSRLEGRYSELREAVPAERIPGRAIEALTRDESLALFSACLGHARSSLPEPDASLAFDLTGGNPLFIREVAGHWRDTNGRERVPATLRELISTRMGRLSVPAQRVIHCCALLGGFADVTRVAAVLRVEPAELLESIDEVDSLGLLGTTGSVGSLVLHDVWQEELVSGLKPAARALLHLRCGEILEQEVQQDRGAPIAQVAAKHFLDAAAPARAIRLLEVAADYQAANGLAEDAAVSLSAALAIASNDADTARLSSKRIQAMLMFGAWRQIRAAIGAAISVHQRVTLSSNEHSDLELVDVEATLVADADPWRTITRAAACVDSSMANPVHKARAARLGMRAAMNMYLAERMHFFRAAGRRIESSDVAARTEVLALETVFETELGNLPNGLEIARSAVATHRATGTIRGLIDALRYLAMPLRTLGRFGDAMATVIEAYEISAANRLPDDAARSADLVATAAFEAGDSRLASEWLDRAVPWTKRVETPSTHTSHATLRAMIALEAGNIEEAATMAPPDLASATTDRLLAQRLYRLSTFIRVRLAARQTDDLDRAVDALVQLLDHSREFRRTEYHIVTAVRAIGQLRGSSAAAEFLNSRRNPARDSGCRRWRELTPNELAILYD